MCLQTTWKEPKIAEEDWVVYKELKYDNWKERNIVSVYANFLYKIGKTYTTELAESDDNGSYDMLAANVKNKYKVDGIEFKSIGQGFHAARTGVRIDYNFPGIFLAECIIPKGAEYYEDDSGLIVANKIKIVKIV